LRGAANRRRRAAPAPGFVPDPEVMARYEALHEWRKQRAPSAALSLM
jgi:hypothetical protein